MTSVARTYAQHNPPASSIDADCPRTFEVFGESHYCLALDALGVTFEVDRLRRDRSELIAELTVRCSIAGARTVDGVLSVADLNLSSVRARQDRARYLGQRAHAGDIDWTGLLEELAQRVLTAERAGRASVDLRTVHQPAPDAVLDVLGVPILPQHPMIVFGDGGTLKSLYSLYVAGELRRRYGLRVGFLDYELDAGDHRARLFDIYGDDMPEVRYLRCDKPLVHMRDAIQRTVQADRLDYVVVDSIAFACDGPPEAAEVAGRYFQAVRSFGVGSLHLAHISKAEGADKRPFGSAFWHNGARSTWYVKLAETEPGGQSVTVGLYHRKANLSGLLAPRGVRVTFGPRTTFERIDLQDVPDLAATLPVSSRLRSALRVGALTRQAISEELADVAAGTIQKTLKRAIERGQVLQFPGPDGQPRFGLADRGGQS